MLDGIGRSSIELIKRFIEIDDPNIQFKIYCSGAKSLFFNFYHWGLKHYRMPLSLRSSSMLSQYLEPLIRKHFMSYDMFHITNNFENTYNNENYIVTIHDMIQYEDNPKCRPLFEKTGKNARAIITCSEYSKMEIVRLLNVQKEKIIVIPWGINHSIFFKRTSSDVKNVLDQYNIRTPYFFSCSCGHKRKNPDITLKAFADLINSNVDATLVIVWGNCPMEIKKKYEQLINDNHLIIVNGVSNDELACLYTGALASYYISSAEGFGFPILESFACGTPCVTCANTSLTEIGKGMAYYVKERDIIDTRKSMEHFLYNGKQGTQMLMSYAQTFNWETTAMSYIDLYKKIMNIE